MKSRFDVAVVGGGPAGLASALFLARQGWKVVVFEKRDWPVDKACGEGIMPTGLAVLKRLGVKPSGSPFYGISYRIWQGPQAQARFAEGPGLAVRRTELSQSLVDCCRAHPNIELRPHTTADIVEFSDCGVTVQASCGLQFQVSLVVGADGLQSRLRRHLPQPLGANRGQKWFWRWGLRRHFHCQAWNDLVEVHLAQGCEAYVTPAGPGLVGVAILCRRPLVELGFDRLLEHFPSIVQRLGQSPPASQVRSAGPFEQRVAQVARPGLVLVGDAAGYVDASTGEGISLALGQAEKLAQLLGPPPAICCPIPAEYLRWLYWQHLPYRLTTYLTLFLGEWPVLRRWIVHGLSWWPGLFRWLLSLNMGHLRTPLGSVAV